MTAQKDEEFFNILKGDMSLVGTRPPTWDEWEKYELHHRARLAIKPGITGLAQINGRNAISWEKRFEYDVQYVDSITFIGDWKIIFKTVGKVFKREGISSATSVTMEEFMGSEVEITTNE